MACVVHPLPVKTTISSGERGGKEKRGKKEEKKKEGKEGEQRRVGAR